MVVTPLTNNDRQIHRREREREREREVHTHTRCNRKACTTYRVEQKVSISSLGQSAIFVGNT